MKPTQRPATPSLEPIVPSPIRLVTREPDRTQIMYVGDLLARRRASLPPPAPASDPAPVTPAAAPAPAPPQALLPSPSSPPPGPAPASPARPTFFAKLGRDLSEASLPKKAILVLLPLCGAMLLLRAQRPLPAAAAAPRAAATSSAALPAPAGPQTPGPAAALGRELPAEPAVSASPRAAADRLAAGDFSAALAQYRELARRSPEDASYREAVRILERRTAPH